MEDEKLKDCPFCGGEAEIVREGNRSQSTQYACTDCGCQLETPETFGFGGYWNQRTAIEHPNPPPMLEWSYHPDMKEGDCWLAEGSGGTIRLSLDPDDGTYELEWRCCLIEPIESREVAQLVAALLERG